MRILCLASLVLTALGATTFGQQALRPTSPIGVLVGVHRRSDVAADSTAPDPATLRTLWLESSGATSTTVPHLLVPRATGFWRIELVHFCKEEPDFDFEDKPIGDALDVNEELWAYPIEARPVIPEGQTCQSKNVHCINDHQKVLFWVWPDFVSMEDAFEPPGCGASMWFSLDYTMRRVESLDKPIAFSEAFGPKAQQRMRTAFDAAREEDASAHGPECVQETAFQPTSWRIIHEEGDWHLQGWANTHRLCGVGFDYTVATDLRPVTGLTGAPLAEWRPVPGATDALASPDGRWALVMARTELLLIPSATPASPVAKAALSEDDSVVMVEWAVGSHINRWRRQVQTLSGRPR